MAKPSVSSRIAPTVVAILAASGATLALLFAKDLVSGVPRNDPAAVGQGVSQVSAYLAMTEAGASDEPLVLQSANGGVSSMGTVWSLKVGGRVSVIVQNAAYDLCRNLATARLFEAEARFVNSGQPVRGEACIPDLVRKGSPYQANVVVFVMRNAT